MDAGDRARAALDIMGVLAANQRPDSRLKLQLDIFLKELPGARAEHIFHDLLAEHYRPTSFEDRRRRQRTPRKLRWLVSTLPLPQAIRRISNASIGSTNKNEKRHRVRADDFATSIPRPGPSLATRPSAAGMLDAKR